LTFNACAAARAAPPEADDQGTLSLFERYLIETPLARPLARPQE
jgi:hypothetical protein